MEITKEMIERAYENARAQSHLTEPPPLTVRERVGDFFYGIWDTIRNAWWSLTGQQTEPDGI